MQIEWYDKLFQNISLSPGAVWFFNLCIAYFQIEQGTDNSQREPLNSASDSVSVVPDMGGLEPVSEAMSVGADDAQDSDQGLLDSLSAVPDVNGDFDGDYQPIENYFLDSSPA
jgi:hypothetical protein